MVPLDAYPNQDRVDGEWLTRRRPLLVGLAKQPGAKPAHVEITGTDDQLAGTLRKLAHTRFEYLGRRADGGIELYYGHPHVLMRTPPA